jgi:hypothetical protein
MEVNEENEIVAEPQIPKEIQLEVEEDDIESKMLKQDAKEIGESKLEVEKIDNERSESSFLNIFYYYLCLYLKKFAGVEGKVPPNMTKSLEILYSSILGFTGIILISITDFWYLNRTFYTHHDVYYVNILTGAYAASAVLLYEAYQSPLSQPRNVLGGYLISSFLGVSTRIVCNRLLIENWIAGPIALALGLAGMNLTKTLHPPGGACALIAVIGGNPVHALGYGYVLTSLGGACIMLAVAVIGNNLIPTRQYPMYWW